jgi:hypothetical protein
MSSARTRAAAALLADGRVLVAGGEDANGPLATAELYDGGTQVFSPAAPMGVARARAAAVALSDGRVLVTGGLATGGEATSAAEIYDPGTESWSAPADMGEARSGHTASLLTDGRVLIVGGEGTLGVSSTLEIFDPATGAFAPAGGLSSPRTTHAAALLADGRVLIAGGSDGFSALSSTDIFDPATGLASPGPALSTPRAGASATTLLDSKVLIAGGSDGTSELASAEVYVPAIDAFSATTGGLATARQGHLAFLLPFNNQVLIVGGTSGGAATVSAELFAPWNDRFRATGVLSEARAGAAGSPLKLEGRLLVAGGSGLSSAELYGFATVKTDKADYTVGETVTITGAGWEPGETVALLLTEVPKTHDDRTLTATADAAGNIFNNAFVPEEHDVGVQFYLTATGAASQAQTTFRDAPPVRECETDADCPDDGNPCTDDLCNPAGNCRHDAAKKGTPCDDSNPCTVDDKCDSKECIPGTARNCDDGFSCTTDSCDSARGGCVNTPVNSACVDGVDACTTVTCDPSAAGHDDAGCVHTAKSCDDANACTDDSCMNGECVNLPNNGNCDDHNICTLDICSPVTGGCVHTPDPGAPILVCKPKKKGGGL